MAKRSDFVQKLLDDLRLRKERMAMSQNSNHSSHLSSADRYRNFKRPSQGSIEINPSETLLQIGSKTWDKTRRSDTRYMSMAIQESSKHLVPLGRGQSLDNIADFSMALAFALKNGRNLRKMDMSEIKIGQNSHRSQPLNGQFPTISQLQIKEISRGAQKLNQILKSCCNGLNFDQYSIEVGKELLKGAIDLEESLRMLVNLQEASDSMVRPQRRQQARLIEIDGDNDVDDSKLIIEEKNNQKQLDRPKFSFHRHTRSTLEGAREANKSSTLEQTLLALTNHAEAFHLDTKQQVPTASKLVSHKRSASCVPNSGAITTFINTNKNSKSTNTKSEKVRIPNVIAKLMGLQELPPNTESKVMAQKEPSAQREARSGKDSNKILQERSKRVELKTIDSERHAPQIGSKKPVQINKSLATSDKSLILHTDEVLPNAPTESVAYAGRLHTKHQQNMEETKKLAVKANYTTQSSAKQLQQNADVLVDTQEKGRIKENTKPKEHQRIKRAESRELSLSNQNQKVSPQILKHPDLAHLKEDKVGTQEIVPQKERKGINGRLLESRNQQKHHNSFQLPNNFQPSETVEREQQKTKQNVQAKKLKGYDSMLKNSSKPKENIKNLKNNMSSGNHTLPRKKTSMRTIDAMPPKISLKGTSKKDLANEGNYTSFTYNKKKSLNENFERQRPSSMNGNTGLENVSAPISTARNVKLEQVPSKLDNKQVGNVVHPEAIIENEPSNNTTKPSKKQNSFLQPSQRTNNETRTSKEAETSTEASNLAQELQKNTRRIAIFGDCMEDEKKGQENEFNNATIQHINIKASDLQKISSNPTQNDKAPTSPDIVSLHAKGAESTMVGMAGLPKQEENKFSRHTMPDPLTENEKHLKQILVESQLFLNAAEALFRLHIPVDIFHASANNKHQDEENKVVLDCAYEVMKRKGRRQELMYQSHTSVGAVNVKCLDDLVKELHRDLEMFKSSIGNRWNEHNAADLLHEMLQKDIGNRNPDVNCMWDFGWSDTMSTYLEKEEIVRDVEKYMLNGLIDEVMRDLLPVTVAF